ncbi:MAG: hypothetical protein ACP5GU_04915 [Thermoprotei archaeon]|jgi:hypothetical protein
MQEIMKTTKLLILGIGSIALLIVFPQVFLVLLIFTLIYLLLKKYNKNQQKRNVRIRDVIKYTFGRKPRKLIFLGDINDIEVFKVSNTSLFILHKGISIKCIMGAKINAKSLGEKKINDVLNWMIEKSFNGYPISVIITRNMEIKVIAESSRNGLRVTQEIVNDLIAETSSILKNTLEMILPTNESNSVKILDYPLINLGDYDEL